MIITNPVFSSLGEFGRRQSEVNKLCNSSKDTLSLSATIHTSLIVSTFFLYSCKKFKKIYLAFKYPIRKTIVQHTHITVLLICQHWLGGNYFHICSQLPNFGEDVSSFFYKFSYCFSLSRYNFSVISLLQCKICLYFT